MGRRLVVLRKATAPPGAGWSPIPRGKRGGFRRRSRSGKGWDYWYPDGKTKAPAKPKQYTRGTVTQADRDLAAKIFDTEKGEAAHKAVSDALVACHRAIQAWDARVAGERINRKKLNEALDEIEDLYWDTVPELKGMFGMPHYTEHLGLRFETQADSIVAHGWKIVEDALRWRKEGLNDKERGALRAFKGNPNIVWSRGLFYDSVRGVIEANEGLWLHRQPWAEHGFQKRDRDKMRETMAQNIADLRQLPEAHRRLLKEDRTTVRVLVNGGRGQLEAAAHAGIEPHTAKPLITMLHGSVYNTDEDLEEHATLLHEVGHIVETLVARRNRVSRRQAEQRFRSQLEGQGTMERVQRKRSRFDTERGRMWKRSINEWFAEAYRYVYSDGSEMLTDLQAGDFDHEAMRKHFDELVEWGLEGTPFIKASPRGVRFVIASSHGDPMADPLRKAAAPMAKPRPARPGQQALPGMQKPAGQAPHPGEQLVVSKKNPRVRRWQRIGQDPKAGPKTPTADVGHDVRFRHPTTGEAREGKVHASGAKGATIIDHETGEAHKVEHGHYARSKADHPSQEGKEQPEGGQQGAAGERGQDDGEEKALPNYREQFPGLSKYPPKGVKAEVGGSDVNWSLRWRSPTTKKLINSYPVEFLVKNAERKFAKMQAFGQGLGEARSKAWGHMDLGSENQQAVMAAMMLLVDKTCMRAGNEGSAKRGVFGISTLTKAHVNVRGDTITFRYVGKASVPQTKRVKDARLAAFVRHQQSLPGSRLFQFRNHRGDLEPATASKLNAYVAEHTGGSIKDFRTWHATRIFAEAADQIGPGKPPAPPSTEEHEKRIQKAALDVAKLLGHKKGKTRKHFVQHDNPDRELAKKHGGKVVRGGHVAFHTARDRKAYQKALGDTEHQVVGHEDAPEQKPEYEWETGTSLNNYIDPKVVEAYRQGLTLSGGLKKAEQQHHKHLSEDERKFAEYLDKVQEHDPYRRVLEHRKQQGDKPAESDDAR